MDFTADGTGEMTWDTDEDRVFVVQFGGLSYSHLRLGQIDLFQAEAAEQLGVASKTGHLATTAPGLLVEHVAGIIPVNPEGEGGRANHAIARFFALRIEVFVKVQINPRQYSSNTPPVFLHP